MERKSTRRKAVKRQTPVLDIVDHVIPSEVIHDDQSKTDKIKCSYCCKLFDTVVKHKEHICRKLNDFLLKCVSCKKRYVDHYLRENTDKASNEDEGITKHGDSVESNDQGFATKISYQCCICQKMYADLSFTIRHVKYHVQRQAAVAGPALHCGQCSKTFSTKQQLSKHSTVHTDVRPFKCEECDKWFKTLDNVKRHMYVHKEERPFPCPTCNKEFKAKHMLKKHEETHVDERDYECPQCHKKYKAKNSLRDHLLVHSGRRPYKCQECDQAFYRRSHLATHRLVHSKLKPFSCNDCDKSFGRREHLKVHERIHSGEKPFNCTLCERSFNQQAGLQAHLVSHSEDRPYSCVKCTKTFKYQSQVKHHSCKPEDALSMVCVRGDSSDIVTSGVAADAALSESMSSLADGDCTGEANSPPREANLNPILNSPHTIILIQIQNPPYQDSMLSESLTGSQVGDGCEDDGATRSAWQGDSRLQDDSDVMGRGQLAERGTVACVSGERTPQEMIVGVGDMRGIVDKI